MQELQDTEDFSEALVEQLVEECHVLLEKLSVFLQGVSASSYRWNAGPNAGSIGGQVRHILEHFLMFFQAPGAVDYDARTRDPRVEQDIRSAQLCIVEVRSQLRAYSSADRATTAQVMQQVRVAGQQRQVAVASSPARELSFLASHTVHHMALIGMLATFRGYQVDADFGVAAATLRFRQAGTDKVEAMRASSCAP